MALQLPSPITVTPAQDTAIKTAINTVITTGIAVASVDLDSEAKKRLNTIDNIRWPFALRTMTIHVNNFASVLPSFLSLADAKTNFDSVSRIREQKALLYKAIEDLDELSMVAENNVYEYMIAMYDIAQRAQAAGTVPGIQSFIDDIAPLFAQNPAITTPPPVTP